MDAQAGGARARQHRAPQVGTRSPTACKARYVGYEQKHTCKLMEGTEADPVAKVFYREIHYTKRGSTVAEAEQSPPKPTEIFEVQEIFHYLKGKWDY